VKNKLATTMSRIMLKHSTPSFIHDRNHFKIIIGKPQTGDENEKNYLWMLFNCIPVAQRNRTSGFT
jgi:hypothetical protein